MLKENPLIADAGSEKFEAKITKSEFDEPHNDFFYALANFGTLGLISFLLLYFMPAFLLLVY